MVKTVTLLDSNFFFIKNLKSKKKKLALTSFFRPINRRQFKKSSFSQTNQDSTFSHTQENSKMYNITSKYFNFFNNKPPVRWVAHITRDFLICYSCSYHSSMLLVTSEYSVATSNNLWMKLVIYQDFFLKNFFLIAFTMK